MPLHQFTVGTAPLRPEDPRLPHPLPPAVGHGRTELGDAQDLGQSLQRRPGAARLPQVEPHPGAGDRAPFRLLDDPEHMVRAEDVRLHQRAGDAVQPHPAGRHPDLVREHEVGQDADSEPAVGVEPHGRLHPFPLRLLQQEVGLLGEAAPGVGEHAAQLRLAHADTVVRTLQVGASVVVRPLDEVDPALVRVEGPPRPLQELRPGTPVAARVQGVLIQLAHRQAAVLVELGPGQQAAYPAVVQPEPRAAGERSLRRFHAVRGDPCGQGRHRLGDTVGQGAPDREKQSVQPLGVLAQGLDHGLVLADRLQHRQLR